jgi:DNA mismatch endonuclease (patch repair protein)
MADTLSREARSARMAGIKSKNTKPEMLVRRALWAAGFRYRLHKAGLPGKPDLVFPGLRCVVLVHGCFWHAHRCQKGRIPGDNRGFWMKKFELNKARDKRNVSRLRSLGWSVMHVWECQLATPHRREKAYARLIKWLTSKSVV